MSCNNLSVGVPVSSEIFVKLVKEMENPGMFMDPMNGPFKILTGIMSLASVVSFYSM